MFTSSTFEDPIQRALWAANRRRHTQSRYSTEAIHLLLGNRDDILVACDEMRRLRAEIAGLDLDWVVTHGDPNLANILVDESVKLQVVDWGDVALGPPERDLSFFTGAGFESFFRHYMAHGGSSNLNESVFAFYQLRWTLQEIADYSTRILFQDTRPVEDEHAWRELSEYLPIRRAEMTAGLRETMAVVHKVLGA